MRTLLHELVVEMVCKEIPLDLAVREFERAYLEQVLAEMRGQNLLGVMIAGKAGFHFDIKIQFGAGAYVCGEE